MRVVLTDRVEIPLNIEKEEDRMEYFLSRDEIYEYNQLVVNLYGEQDYETALNGFLYDIQKLVPFEKGDIYTYKQDDGHISVVSYISVGYGEINWQEYCEIDDVLPLISVPQPIMFRSSDIFLQTERKKTDYYQKMLEPAGMNFSIEGNLYVESIGYIVGIGIHRSRECGDFSQTELEIMKLIRPHLSKVAQKFCEEKKAAINIFDTTAALAGSDEVGIWIWNWQAELVGETVGESDFIHEHKDELKNILKTLCLRLKHNLDLGTSSSMNTGQMKSKVMISEKSYYVDISYREYPAHDEKVFVAILYDYTGIINNIMSDMKENFNLSPREYEVFQCLVRGMCNQEIQDELFISLPTVKKHLSNIYQKLGVNGRHQLINSIL